MGRSPCCAKEGLNRGAWTAHEDKILTDYIKAHGEGRWRNLPKRAGLKRCGKSCRLRWLNYLRPDIKRGNISADEEELIIRLHKLLGNRWSLIAGRLPGRTDNEIKNYWNTNLGKKVHQNSASKHNKYNNKGRRMMKKGDDEGRLMVPSSGGTTPSSHHVVRTRAIRCSKVFINPRPTKIESTSFDSNSSIEAKASINDNGDSAMKYQTSARSTPSEEMSDHNNILQYSSDFMLDFNMGEFCLSDLLSSDFADLGDLNYSNDSSSSSGLSPISSSDRPLIFSEEMPLQERTSSPPQNVASFLDYGHEWLAE